MKKSVVQAWKKLFDGKADLAMFRYALTGDGSSAATADVEGRSGWAWVRYDEKEDRASQVINNRYPGIAQGVPVVIGKEYPTDRYYQVLGLNTELYYRNTDPGTYPSYLTPAHGSTHRGDTGSDPVPVVTANIIHGRARQTNPVSMNVFVETLYYEYNSGIAFWPGGTISMSGHVPSGSNTHRYVLVSIDASTNTLVATDGIVSPTTVSPTLPNVPTQNIPIAAVMLQNGATEVDYDIIYDYRMLFAVAGSVAQMIVNQLAIVEDDLDFELSKHVVEG